MTGIPQGRDESASVAALAIEVSRLRHDLQSLTAKVEAAAAQQEHPATSQAIGELRNQVEQILAALADQAEPTPSRWFWVTMNKEQREQQLSELHDWVETVLRIQYPSYLASKIKPCWPAHPEARWELAWLYQLWTRAYLTRHPSPAHAADWHDRWIPGVLHRLSTVMHHCDTTCQRASSRTA